MYELEEELLLNIPCQEKGGTVTVTFEVFLLLGMGPRCPSNDYLHAIGVVGC